ncbi:unnamed protein product [Ambrosiozyma monospora]|uniref:Unnamed protein product n=1 Tax=Ambrosiozyma monospora TaxID=43982 RepID=A0ACB5T2P6_AMBMO|nr:unnamed protein product [Ambrosiozyma monospora]
MATGNDIERNTREIESAHDHLVKKGSKYDIKFDRDKKLHFIHFIDNNNNRANTNLPKFKDSRLLEDQMKLLQVILDKNLNLKAYIEAKTNAFRRLQYNYKKFVKHLTVSNGKDVYNVCCRPVLEYVLEVWGWLIC